MTQSYLIICNQDVQGTKPCKRYGHTANLWNDNCILIFGNISWLASFLHIDDFIGGCDERAEYCNDLHVYDIEKNTWYQPEIHGSVVPRYLHSATVFQDKLFVYGGFARKATCMFGILLFPCVCFSFSHHTID